MSITNGEGSITISSNVPNGTKAGDMLYWNGTAWINVAVGSNGQTLFLNNGVPSWGNIVGAAVGVVNAGEILSPSGRIWMDRNLGATSVATSSTDFNAYGSLYQWGRASDGHELINWTGISTGIASNTVTSTLSSSNQPGNALFITAGSNNWRTFTNDGLWVDGVDGLNVNPCPTGFSVPSKAEWEAEGLTTSIMAFNVLKLTLAGQRSGFDGGALQYMGYNGFYWSKDLFIDNGSVTVYSWRINITSSQNIQANMGIINKSYGLSIRCIKN